MATSSIFEQVRIMDKNKVRKFVEALERSKEQRTDAVSISRPVEMVKDPDAIRKIFGVQKDDGVQTHIDGQPD